MLDKQTEMMLQIAATLTAEDLDALRGQAIERPAMRKLDITKDEPVAPDQTDEAEPETPEDVSPVKAPARNAQRSVRPTRPSAQPSSSNLPRGEYERQRPRESKISTACIGHERERHDWWPVGTELVGHMGSQLFSAMVVENAQVKSGRSIMITSGAASGKVCITPTRAAIEATEDYRQAHNLGRGGGVTNGWQFWQPNT